MTQDQIMSLIRVALQIGGTLATAFGWIAPEKVAVLTSQILSALGPLMIAGGTIWSIISNTKASIIKSASAMPEVNSPLLVDAISDPMLKKAAASQV